MEGKLTNEGKMSLGDFITAICIKPLLDRPLQRIYHKFVDRTIGFIVLSYFVDCNSCRLVLANDTSSLL